MQYSLNYAQFSLILAALLLSILIAYLLVRRRGKIPFVKLLVTGILWSLGSVFQSFSTSFLIKSFWQQWIETGQTWLPVAWLAFILNFARPEQKVSSRSSLLIHMVPVIFTIAIWTNPLHNLFWNELILQPGHRMLTEGYGPLGYLSTLYGYGLVFYTAVVLFNELSRSHGIKRKQTVILAFCAFVPWLFNFVAFISNGSINDYTPHLFSISAVLVIIGLIRYRLLNIMPIGYETMIAGMRNGVLILNSDHGITYANPAMLDILRLPSRAVVNKPAEQALSGYPELLKGCSTNGEELLREIVIQNDGTDHHYELHLVALKEKQGEQYGQMVTLHNITKRVTAEQASRHNRMMLMQSEEKYRSLVENITDVIFIANEEGIITYLSPVMKQFTGFPPDIAVGKPIDMFIYPEDLTDVKTKIAKALSGQAETMHFRIIDRAGKMRYVQANVSRILQEGKPVSLQGVATDITERVQVEQALERRALQLTILSLVGDQIVRLSELDHVLDSAVDLIQQTFGYYHVGLFTPNPVSGELVMRASSGFFSEQFPENHRLKYGQGIVGWVAVYHETVLSNDVRQEPRYTNLYPDKIYTRSELAVPIMMGETMLGVLDVQSPLENAFDEKDVSVMETVANQIAVAIENARLYDELRLQLKERERRENILRIQRDLLIRLSASKTLVETLQGAIEALQVELRADRASISVIDWTDLVARPKAACGYPETFPHQPIPLDQGIVGWVARFGEPVLITDVRRDPRKDELYPGTRSFISVPLIADARVIGVICVESATVNAYTEDDLRLLTTLANSLVVLVERARLIEEIERARVELEQRAQDLENANASLRELDRIKSQFLANMSHELRTPLNSIIGFSEVMIDEIVGPLNNEQKDCARDIRESGRHLLALINDLLDFSKIETGHLKLEVSAFSIRSLFDDLRATVFPLIEKKQQKLIVQIPETLPPVTADALRIKQVLINLLSNANKFTPEKGIITASCRVTGENQDQILFAISDDGIGIRPDDHQLIFEEFRQVDGSLTREVSGTGLGLAISKQIVEMHQGKIWVESDLGKGATFYISLPVQTAFQQDAVQPVL